MGVSCDLLSMGASLLGGSWVVITGIISRVYILITHIRGLITPIVTRANILITHIGGLVAPIITTHEPPSSPESTSNPGARARFCERI